jgi:hypothetical protein
MKCRLCIIFMVSVGNCAKKTYNGLRVPPWTIKSLSDLKFSEIQVNEESKDVESLFS